jgi:RNA polymerase sigma-70 factor (ECF subfamily)
MSEAELQTATLVSQASAGSAVAVDTLLERLLPGLRAYIRLRAGPVVRARESVSDLAQSVCREILENLDRFQYGGERGFKSWLYATALRRIQDKHAFHTAQKRDVQREVRPAIPGRSAAALDLLAYARSFSSPSAHAMAHEELARIELAFDGLTDDQRDLIVRARLIGQSHAEIAAELGKSEGATRVALHRALARLAGLLDGESA